MTTVAADAPAGPPVRRPPAAWRVILGHARPHRRTIALAGVLSVLGSAAGLAQPLTAARLVDRLGREEPLVGVLLLLTGLVLLGAVLRAIGDYLLGRTAESVVLGARRRLVGRLLRLPMPVVERTEPGDLMSRVTSDTVLLREVASRSVVEGFTGALTMVAIIVLMGVLDPVLLAVTLVVLVVTGVVLAVLLPRIRAATRRSQEAVGAVGAVLERALGALRTVKASAAEEREAAVADRAVERAWSEGVRAARWNAVAGTVTGLAVQTSFLAVLGVGGARVADEAIPVSTLVAFLLFLFYLVGPIGQVVQTTTQLQVGAAAVARIDEVEAMGVEAAGPDGAVEPRPGPPARVELRDVVFRYRDEREPVHAGVTFAAATGGVTALVGPSGAGKSTVFALLERFHEAEAGEVLVDGRDVREWPLHELRAVIGYVEQDSPVLSGTLRDNLLFAAPGAPDADLADVLRRTRLDGLVAGLPDGLDTAVGPRGTTLSGGEKQRIAIARALLRRPRLLLLDEATSQLDARNEAALREVVLAAAGDATVLVVAHRLSTITSADRIVVVDAGRVRATGTHEELLRSDPLYGELAATQFLT